ncbi:hypothetical protein [Paenalcaligenes faecalis]|uniref:hypothetical protein n=1 Tax=Paenalcaligenes faecalis TaxID=2980099 RepID=UPI0022B9A774|nr:hypothetical protein [Paenalcaligenes faecalis]
MDDTLKSLHNEELVTDASSLATLHKMHELNKEQTLAFIEVLVSREESDVIGQLMVGYVSDNSDTAWVLIDGKPVEVNVTAIDILEIRDSKNDE